MDAEKTCKTCRHWGSEKDASEDFRECQAIPHASQGTERRDEEWETPYPDEYVEGVMSAPAVTVDGSGYFAALQTKADFGCTLWAPQEDVGKQ